MNKKYLIYVGVAVIVVIGIVFLADQRSKNTAPVSVISGAESGAVPTPAAGFPTPSAPQAGAGRVSIALSPTYSGSSFKFDYPAGWNLFAAAPVSITNFGGKYEGNAIPMGGAEIDFATTTATGNLKDIMATELMSAANIAAGAVTVDGISCTEVRYDSTFTGGVKSKNIAVYCTRGAELWKIYLSYRAGDPAAPAHLNDFKKVLDSMKFLP